jgi:hypothetical protein
MNTSQNRLGIFLTVAMLTVLGACAPNTIYRTKLENCISHQPSTACRPNANQHFEAPEHPDEAYRLGFVEFDDQGQLWERKQMRSVIDEIYKQSPGEDVLMVIFAHGWQHNASPGDTNIVEFRKILRSVSRSESYFAKKNGTSDRKVFGVYLGWRGQSVTVPGLNLLSFWDRKATSQKVGDAGVSEVLSRLELIQKTKDAVFRAGADKQAIAQAEKAGQLARSRTRLVIIGHSFGGALVHSSIEQLLKNRFIETGGSPHGVVTNARGFGNLVVLINPAFEANLYSTMSDMANGRGFYFDGQDPVLAVLTSEADLATKIAFPLGRSFSTIFENTRIVPRENRPTKETQNINQDDGNITTIGHFEPYRTHYLAPSKSVEEVKKQTIQQSATSTVNVIKSWRNDKPGGKIDFQGSVLERTTNSVARNPYLVVKVSKELIPSHNEIYDPRVTAFIRQLILITAQ